MKLSGFFRPSVLARDGEFDHLANTTATVPGSLCYADTLAHLQGAAKNPHVTSLLLATALGPEAAAFRGGLLLSDTPRDDFWRVYRELVEKGSLHSRVNRRVASTASIHPTASVAEYVQIGDHTEIGPMATILDGVTLGDHVRVGPGAVVGADGILHYREEGRNVLLKHAGFVRVGNGASLLAQSTVVKSIFPHTVTEIGEAVILGIGSTVGHEASVGKNAVISGNCVIARAATIGEEAWIGTGAVVREYLLIGAGARVMAGAVVVKHVAPRGEVSGNFAIPHDRQLREYARLSRTER